jgi:hypothetical protein
MAATLVEEGRIEVETRAFCWGTVTLDASHLAAGEAIDATGDLGYDVVIFEGGPYVLQWDKANQKVLAYYGDNNNAADGPLIAVPDTTDLSAVVAQYIAIAGAA